MHSTPTPFTRVALAAALTLSFSAVVLRTFRPRPTIPPPGQVTLSTGSQVKVEARTSHPALGTDRTEFFVEYTVTLEGDSKPFDQVSMAVVLDRSGSMNGQKMEDARRAVHRLIDLSRDGDELAVVAFGSDVSPGQLHRVSAETRALLHAEVDALTASGGTNLSAGLQRGRESLRNASGARRLVIVSDGQPTEGETVSVALNRMVAELHLQTITVSALGVGSDYDGELLTRLSEAGGGMLGHLQNPEQLEEVLAQELGAARLATGRNVSLHLKLDGADFLDAPGRQASFERGELRLPLADLRPHVPTRVVVHLRGGGNLVHDDKAQVEARVVWRDGEGGHASQVAVSMPVTDELDQVRRDEATYARGVTAIGSLKMLAAASAYERGDDSLGARLLDDARGVFGMSADALAGQSQVDALRGSMSKSSHSERKTLGYQLQKKTMANFGRENEGY